MNFIKYLNLEKQRVMLGNITQAGRRRGPIPQGGCPKSPEIVTEEGRAKEGLQSQISVCTLPDVKHTNCSVWASYLTPLSLCVSPWTLLVII